MARSSWKFIPTTKNYWYLSNQFKLFKKITRLCNRHILDEKMFKIKVSSLRRELKRVIFSRYLVITKTTLKCKVFIHKGNIFRKLFLTRYMLGKKFGEFSITRKPFKYPIKKKRKNFLRR